MENGGAAESQPEPRKQRYQDEDLSPTTSRELRGFYTYGLAAEVFAVCGVGRHSFKQMDNGANFHPQDHFSP